MEDNDIIKNNVKFENHILIELDVLYKFYPYEANRIKLTAYSNELVKLGVSSDAIKSFVRYRISYGKGFPEYSDIITYLETNKLIGNKNKGFDYPECKLCGNSEAKGMWELLRNDGYFVAATCICNNEQSKEHYFRFNPNNLTARNGMHCFLEGNSFNGKTTKTETPCF
jgi:hypothetical protein